MSGAVWHGHSFGVQAVPLPAPDRHRCLYARHTVYLSPDASSKGGAATGPADREPGPLTGNNVALSVTTVN